MEMEGRKKRKFFSEGLPEEAPPGTVSPEEDEKIRDFLSSVAKASEEKLALAEKKVSKKEEKKSGPPKPYASFPSRS